MHLFLLMCLASNDPKGIKHNMVCVYRKIRRGCYTARHEGEKPGLYLIHDLCVHAEALFTHSPADLMYIWMIRGSFHELVHQTQNTAVNLISRKLMMSNFMHGHVNHTDEPCFSFKPFTIALIVVTSCISNQKLYI